VVGQQTATLLGSLLLTQLWQTIQRRAVVPLQQRHPVMMVIDEVQDYVKSVAIGDMLAQARGLGASLTLAHQALSQLPPTVRSAVMANARSRVVFRPASSDAKHLAAALGGGLAADDLERLGAFEASVQLLVDHRPTPPFSVQTRPLATTTTNTAELRQRSQQRYGTSGAELDTALTMRWQGRPDAPNGPIGVRRRGAA
jgi:DNA helicase HerA-like ATPase